ncbi:MAG: PEP-CTERM sorting domain-containing protein [Phycisphaerae bacterium]|nr:PEP-CTERM sorting domain-containing protein [Phycisphaerae bacterium]
MKTTLRNSVLAALAVGVVSLVSAGSADAGLVLSEDFSTSADWDSGQPTVLNQNVPAYYQTNLDWLSPNVNTTNTTNGGTLGKLLVNSYGGGSARVMAKTAYNGVVTVSADFSVGDGEAGLLFGDLGVVVLGGPDGYFTRVERVSAWDNLSGNHDMGFTAATGGIMHHMTATVTPTTRLLDITITDAPGGGSATYHWTYTYTAGMYTEGTSKVGLYRGGNGAAWFDNLQISTVPEPATMAFLAIGGLSMIGATLRRRRKV